MLADFATYGSLEGREELSFKPPLDKRAYQIFSISADRAEGFGLRRLRMEVFVGGDESLEVANRIFAEGHLAHVIFPHIRFDRPAGERFPVDGDHLPLSVHAGIGDSRDNELHSFALPPEGASEIMRENQGIKSAFGGQEHDCLVDARPLWRDIGLIPAAKIKAVDTGQTDQHVQSLFASHSTLSIHARQDSPAFRRFGPWFAPGTGKDCGFYQTPPYAMY